MTGAAGRLDDFIAVCAALVTVAEPARADSGIDTGDTAWILTSAALVLLMIPGLAFFYGGLVRKKNILSVLMQCFIMICIISIVQPDRLDKVLGRLADEKIHLVNVSNTS